MNYDYEFLLTTSKFERNKSLLELNEQTTQFDFNSFARSEYSHNDYDNYINPDKKKFPIQLMETVLTMQNRNLV